MAWASCRIIHSSLQEFASRAGIVVQVGAMQSFWRSGAPFCVTAKRSPVVLWCPARKALKNIHAIWCICCIKIINFFRFLFFSFSSFSLLSLFFWLGREGSGPPGPLACATECSSDSNITLSIGDNSASNWVPLVEESVIQLQSKMTLIRTVHALARTDVCGKLIRTTHDEDVR